MKYMNKKMVESIFNIGGFKVLYIEEIKNSYWPFTKEYFEYHCNSPWFLVGTEFGPIKIGWRKRVIEISWENTKIRGIITEDDVTKSTILVHAWTELKAVEYLQSLRLLT